MKLNNCKRCGSEAISDIKGGYCESAHAVIVCSNDCGTSLRQAITDSTFEEAIKIINELIEEWNKLNS